MKALKCSWEQLMKLAVDRQRWRAIVSATCVISHKVDYVSNNNDLT